MPDLIEQATSVQVDPNIASRLMTIGGFSRSPLRRPSQPGPLWARNDHPNEIFTYSEGLHIALRTIANMSDSGMDGQEKVHDPAVHDPAWTEYKKVREEAKDD